jgi:NAD(P)-dependent dehydrogenase (short-subunit alcohol dehydrogenase family)
MLMVYLLDHISYKNNGHHRHITMKTVVITGASRGIGKALAEKFLGEGYFVIGTSTTGTADFSQSENVLMLSLDLGDPQSIQSCTDHILNLKKPIDIVINNAGIWLPQKNGERNLVELDVLRKVLEVNLIGIIDFTQRLIPGLKTEAHIVNISSRQGSLSYPTGASNAPYKISKAGLNMFTRILSKALEGRAIVSSVHPGAVKSGLASPDANIEPEESAKDIYDFAITKPETGQFWFKGEKFPW